MLSSISESFFNISFNSVSSNSMVKSSDSYNRKEERIGLHFNVKIHSALYSKGGITFFPVYFTCFYFIIKFVCYPSHFYGVITGIHTHTHKLHSYGLPEVTAPGFSTKWYTCCITCSARKHLEYFAIWEENVLILILSTFRNASHKNLSTDKNGCIFAINSLYAANHTWPGLLHIIFVFETIIKVQ